MNVAADSVAFPCDLCQWPEVRRLLLTAKNTTSSQALISDLQKVFNCLHGREASASDLSPDIGAKPKVKNAFTWLKAYLDLQISSDECTDVLERVIPYVIDRAISIENYEPEDALQLLRQDETRQCVISQQLATSLVACAFLCLFPTSRDESCVAVNFNEVLSGLESEWQDSGIRCVMEYFSRSQHHGHMTTGHMTFTRQVLPMHLNPEDLLNISRSLCPVTLHRSSYPRRCMDVLQVFVGTQLYGGYVFTVDPELIASLLFTDILDDDETLVIDFSKCLQLTSEVVDSAPSGAQLVVHSQQPDIRFVKYTPTDTSNCQIYDRDLVLKEIGRLSALFYQQPEHCQPKIYSGKAGIHPSTVESGDTDVPPCNSSSDSIDHSNTHCSRASRKAAFSSNKTKSWRSMSSASSFNMSMSRGISFDLESSSTSSAADEAPAAVALPRRRSSALHGLASSRRGTLQGQSSTASECSSGDFAAYSRRRSSGLSDVSLRSSSSSGKRSSADLSSEVEEYFENLQHRSLKTSVIEEETGFSGAIDHAVGCSTDPAAMSCPYESGENNPLPGCGDYVLWEKSSQKTCQRLHMAEVPPTVATLQVPKRSRSHDRLAAELMPSGDAHCQNLLEHFVDNLINEAAQESKYEIESLVQEQQVSGDTAQRPVHSFRMSNKGEGSQMSGCYFCSVKGHAENSSRSKVHHTVEQFAEDLMGKIMSEALASCAKQGLMQGSQRAGICVGNTQDDLDEFVSTFVDGIFADAIAVCHKVPSRGADHGDEIAEGDFDVEDQRDTAELQSSDTSAGLRSYNISQSSVHNVSPHLERQRTLSGFKDAVLSDFEDELISSNTDKAPLISFADLKRRSSEPANLGRSFRSSRHAGRCRHATITSLSVSSECHQTSPLNGTVGPMAVKGWFAHPKTCLTDIDAFVQNVIVNAFVEAFGELSIKAFTSSSCHEDPCPAGRKSPPNHIMLPVGDVIAQYADQLSQSIVGQALLESSFIFASESKCMMAEAMNEELERAAANFAEQIIDEAVHIVATQSSVRSIASSISPLSGGFADDPQLYAIMQWIAASHASIPHLHLHCTDCVTQLQEMDRVVGLIVEHGLTTDVLASHVLSWCSLRLNSSTLSVDLFDFLLLCLT